LSYTLEDIINEIQTYSGNLSDHDGSYSLSQSTIDSAIQIVTTIYEKKHILPDRISPAEGVILKYPNNINVEVEEDQIVILV